MFCILTCNGYTVEATAPTLAEAIALCAQLEEEKKDGYARVVSDHGTHVADAEGPYPPPGYYRDAATMTGMYDRDF